MATQIVRMFSTTTGAELARQELLAAGFDQSTVQLWARGDEAGAMQGNFSVGDDPDVTGGHDYRYTFEPHTQAQGCSCTVIVSAADAALAERASELLDRLGATVPGAALRPPG